MVAAMTETIQDPKTTEETTPGNDCNGAPDQPSEQVQSIFAERAEKLMNQFGAACEEGGFDTAVVILTNPESKGVPFVFMRGHPYDNATQLAFVLREMKRDIYTELNPEPQGP